MSRSYKKAIYQDGSKRSGNRWYNKIVRRIWRSITNSIPFVDSDKVSYPDRNSIVEYWNIRDYKINAEYRPKYRFCEEIKKRLSRK